MLIRTLEKRLYHMKVTMTYDDGQVWVPLKYVKESINSIRTAQDGKCTTKQLGKMLEALNIVPVKFQGIVPITFRGKSSLYVT